MNNVDLIEFEYNLNICPNHRIIIIYDDDDDKSKITTTK